METIELVEQYNNGLTLEQLAEKIGISKSTLQKRFSKQGYKLDRNNHKYIKQASCKTNSNNETIKQVSTETNIINETIKQDSSETNVNRTYSISGKLDRAIKIKAAIEGKRDVDVVREALEKYIEQKYKDM